MPIESAVLHGKNQGQQRREKYQEWQEQHDGGCWMTTHEWAALGYKAL